MRYTIIILILIISACTNHSTSENSNFPVNENKENTYGENSQEKLNYQIDTRRLYFADNDTIFEISINYPKVSGEINDTVLQKINKFLYNQFVPPDSIIKEKISEYDGQNDGIENEEEKWHGEESTLFDVIFISKNYLCISNNWQGNYKGAAHGSWSTDYYHFDMRTGEVLNLDSFFNERIYTVIKTNILKQLDTLSKSEQDGFNPKEFSYRFFFNKNECQLNGDNCLNFYFPPYSIVPGLGGSGYEGYGFSLTKDEILSCLKEEWKQEILNNISYSANKKE